MNFNCFRLVKKVNTAVELKDLIDQSAYPPEYFNIFLDENLLNSSNKSDDLEILFKVTTLLIYILPQIYYYHIIKELYCTHFYRKSIDLKLVDDIFILHFFHKTF